MTAMNKKVVTIVYVPGLGTDQSSLQHKIVNTWSRYGFNVRIHDINWSSKDSWNLEFNKLLSTIDSITIYGGQTILVGSSAGASACINAFAERKDKINGCILIAGKVNNPNNVGQSYYNKYPLLRRSLDQILHSLSFLTPADKLKIVSRYAFVDGLVSRSDSQIDGAKNSIIPMIGHAPSIGFVLLFEINKLVRGIIQDI